LSRSSNGQLFRNRVREGLPTTLAERAYTQKISFSDLALAAQAEGDSTIRAVYHIDRGYERIVERLKRAWS